MGTANEMFRRIKREIQRNDVDTEIREAIIDAVRHFQDEPLWMNVKTTEISTTTTTQDADGKGSPRYDVPDDYVSGLYLSIDDNTVINEMKRVTYRELEQMDTVSSSSVSGPFEGVPSYWAFDGPSDVSAASPSTRIRVYPRPQAPKYSNAAGADAVTSTDPYTLRFRYVAKIPAPTATQITTAGEGAFTNFWTTEAERMIRCYAKALVYADVLQMIEAAQAQEKLSELEYNRLIRKSESIEFLTTVQPGGI
tara:strand:- start:1554 stop:2309 length:756 start_codon:yes stop_codon:yes gene_type:complete